MWDSLRWSRSANADAGSELEKSMILRFLAQSIRFRFAVLLAIIGLSDGLIGARTKVMFG